MCENYKFHTGMVWFGLLLSVCGVIQIASGVAFLLLLNILRTTFIIWAGIGNCFLGIILIYVDINKEKHCLRKWISAGITMLNLANMLILELVEFHPIDRETINLNLNDDENISLAFGAYLSVNIASGAALINGLLIAYFQFCSARPPELKADHPDTVEKMKADLSDIQLQSLNWVYPEANLSINVSPQTYPTPLKINQRSREAYNTPNESIFPPANPQRTISSRDISITTLPNGSGNDGNHGIDEAGDGGIVTSWLHSQQNNKFNSIPLKSCKHRATQSTTLLAADKLCIERSKSDRPLSYITSTYLGDDSLINLSRLELLARQWRFKCEHKMLEQKISLRIAASK